MDEWERTKFFVVFDELVDVFFRHVFAGLHRLWRDATDVARLLLLLRMALVGLCLSGGRHDGGTKGRHAALLTAILAGAKSGTFPRV